MDGVAFLKLGRNEQLETILQDAISDVLSMAQNETLLLDSTRSGEPQVTRRLRKLQKDTMSLMKLSKP